MELPRGRRVKFSEDARRARVEKLKQSSGATLPTLSTSALDGKSVQGHVENFLGTMSYPLGLVGPLKIAFQSGLDTVSAPFATTEGALVSSITRGSLAISLSGGATPRVLKQEMTRAPQFEFASIDAALRFRDWVATKFDLFNERTRRKSGHARLNLVEPLVMGRTVHVRFCFSTGNAAGQNMTTFCANDLCRWILEAFPSETGESILDFMIEGNLSSDKKVSHLSASRGRGHSVIVETTISARVLKRVLGLEIDEVISRFHRSKSARIYSGMIGYNINVANVVAGFFLAMGQDVACVHESSIAELHLEQRGDDLYASLMMPSLVVGTVGGGTQLPSARDALASIGCVGDGSSDRLAMIIASFSLALELSTLSAIGAGAFVDAHERHARQLPTQFFKTSDLTADFFKKTLSDEAIETISRLNVENREGYVSDLAFQVSKKYTGHLAFEIVSQKGEAHVESRRAFLKMKPKDREVVLGAARVLATVDPGLADLLTRNLSSLPFKDCHVRELEVYAQADSVFHELSPKYYGSYASDDREVFILIQELLHESDLISPIARDDVWTMARLKAAVAAIRRLHLAYLGQEQKARASVPHMFEVVNAAGLSAAEESLWEGLSAFSINRHFQAFPKLAEFVEETLDRLPMILGQMAALPQTVIHYDFNPRNIAFKNGGTEPVIFDWEFTAWGLPQRDLVELLLFASKPSDVVENLREISTFYLAGCDDEKVKSTWALGLELSMRELLVRRFPFYGVLAHMGACDYIGRMIENANVLVTAGFGSHVHK